VNDSADVLESLYRTLIANRVVPYHLNQLDKAQGTAHFRVPIAKGQEIMRALRGRLSGLAQPTYILDIPGGQGKVPIGPQYLTENEIADPRGRRHRYSD
jgi:lysine 2,3-aminomutase